MSQVGRRRGWWKEGGGEWWRDRRGEGVVEGGERGWIEEEVVEVLVCNEERIDSLVLSQVQLCYWEVPF